MKTIIRSIFVVFALVTAIVPIGCVNPNPPGGGTTPLVAGGTKHYIKVKHTRVIPATQPHKVPHHWHVNWTLQKDHHPAFGFKANFGDLIEWTNETETTFGIMVRNTNNWPIPTNSPLVWTNVPDLADCQTCGVVTTTDSVIQLTFSPSGQRGQYTHYQLIVPGDTTRSRALPYGYNYDLVDATIYWEAR